MASTEAAETLADSLNDWIAMHGGLVKCLTLIRTTYYEHPAQSDPDAEVMLCSIEKGLKRGIEDLNEILCQYEEPVRAQGKPENPRPLGVVS